MARTPKIMAAGLCSLAASFAFAGDLNPPPGPINPTDHVVLNQQAITLPYMITQPGHYKLTSNLTGSPMDGIQISSSDVWIDLNGFTLSGAGAPGDGIVLMGPFENITILNGTVRDWGDDGIDLFMGTNNRVERVTASYNQQEGIETQTSQVIRCQALQNQGAGIIAVTQSVVEACLSNNNGGTGIVADDHSKVANCTSSFNQDGFSVFLHTVCIDSVASDNFNLGFFALESGKLADCIAVRNGGNGVDCFFGGVIVDCVSTENQGAGFLADMGATFFNCKASRNVDGFVGMVGVKFSECSAIENTNYGFFADIGTTVRQCSVSINFTTGIHAVNETLIVDNHCWQNGGGPQGLGLANIEVVGTGNRISGNDCKGAPTNYLVTGISNTVYSNSATLPGPGGNYGILIFPNDVAAITTAAAAANAYGNVAY